VRYDGLVVEGARALELTVAAGPTHHGARRIVVEHRWPGSGWRTTAAVPVPGDPGKPIEPGEPGGPGEPGEPGEPGDPGDPAGWRYRWARPDAELSDAVRTDLARGAVDLRLTLPHGVRLAALTLR
ncbi:MAG: hypothetical protein ACRDQ0_21445, partial [Pseudonocardia sp.]